ncbi:flavin monoamine oxidase family protein [Roseomonas marmotae]|uniref:Tryptophan 2-monooxygenase n=1 Tax=Roseomonas marmotae TaxID=2768161 RepID=A0ABS3K6S6_9PROT|nr:NAD(P)/FAD-dependent oxidoreductase [Roseomonas marmotae]MBO1073165.1 FAD-dependent oxidoreductase [Roseomonas marmotae]QTI79200.1 FAD-dependent oxidoreductase [Roseomonas marmotae]
MAAVDVLVVGAGAAGIAAARALRQAGLTCQVLEARERAGGRAATDSVTLGAPFDLGATWLHAAGRNPLRGLAEQMGMAPFDHGSARQSVCFENGQLVDAAAMAEYDAAWEGFHAKLAAMPRRPGESAAALAVRAGFGAGHWDATILHWEGPVICAAPMSAMDAADWLDTLLEPPDLLLPEGAGSLMRRLAEGLPIAYGAVVRRLDWSGPRVIAEGDFGRLEATAAIVTVPTSVLAAGAIQFNPDLPDRTAQAIHDLPLGLLTKIGLRAAGQDRLGLAPFTGIERRVARQDEAALTAIAWPFGHDHLMGFVGGPHAWALADAGPEATIDFAFEELRRNFGARATQALRRDGGLVSDWGRDPFSRGAYSHALPGRAAARAILAEPLAGGRLCFAGEACHTGLAATLGGAWETGEAAAAHAARAMRGRGGAAGVSGTDHAG